MNILLGVCGSISAYKSIDLCRNFINQGHRVKVILTKGSEHFVVPKVYEYLGAEQVFTANQDFDSNHQGIIHIDLKNWADIFVIAPLSAETLSRLAHGGAADLLQSTFLAWDTTKPITLFPAMNTSMLKAKLVQNNLATLQSLEHCFIHPTKSGKLACGEIGEGKLADIELITDFVHSFTLKKTNRTILISTGATIAPLDSVRYLTNPSSGLTGFYLASEALRNGHRVVLISSTLSSKRIDHLLAHPQFINEKITTHGDLKEKVDQWFSQSDVYISSAAIGDIEFDGTSTNKLKKDQLADHLPIKKTTDVLKSVIQKKEKHQKIVGFAAESNLTADILQKKWKAKPVDLLVGTLVDNGHQDSEQKGFAQESANYTLKTNQKEESLKLSKKELASKIFEILQ